MTTKKDIETKIEISPEQIYRQQLIFIQDRIRTLIRLSEELPSVISEKLSIISAQVFAFELTWVSCSRQFDFLQSITQSIDELLVVDIVDKEFFSIQMGYRLSELSGELDSYPLLHRSK